MGSKDNGNKAVIEKLNQKILEQEKELDALRQSEKRWHLLYHNLPGGSFAVNEDYTIEDVNDVLCTLTGYSRDELIGAKCGTICPKGPHKCPIFDLGKARIDNDETFVKRKDGEFIPVIKSALRVPFGDREFIVENFQDITERKLLEDERLKASNLESIGILAGGIAHDFNNLLTGILGNISLARAVVPGDDELGEILVDAENASLNARDLAGQLLTFSKGGDPVKQVARIEELLVESASFVLRGSNLSCCYEVDKNLWSVDVDKGQISQVVSNLVINAKQATPEGGSMYIRAENVVIQAINDANLAEGRYVKVEVEDSGTGIDPDYISKVFDPYFTTKVQGSGLGLTTSYSIIHRHGGKIIIRNNPGKGVRVTIYLPATTRGQEHQSDESPAGQSSGTRILVMDDNPEVRQVIARMLKNLGHQVVTATDGHDAIARFRQAEKANQPFELVILDLTIPGGIGGADTLQELRKHRLDIKALVSSGYSDHPILSDYCKYGFMGVIPKPYNLEQFKAVISHALQN